MSGMVFKYRETLNIIKKRSSPIMFLVKACLSTNVIKLLPEPVVPE